MSDLFVTGATGNLGSEFCYEFLGERLRNEAPGRIFAAIRGPAIEDRLELLLTHGWVPDYLHAFSLEQLRERIIPVEVDLTCDLDADVLAQLPSRDLVVVHFAASTNVGHDVESMRYQQALNLDGTRRLLTQLGPERLRKFVFVSTAYAVGIGRGVVDESFPPVEARGFRNFYERSKAEMERELRARCDELGVPMQIQRPSMVVGRLTETPLYYVRTFNVIYSYAKYLLRAVARHGTGPFRVHLDPEARVNLVPLDYAAKAMLRAIDHDVPAVNVCCSDGLSVADLWQSLMPRVGLPNFTIVDQRPRDLSALEHAYYSRAEAGIQPYVTEPTPSFACDLIRSMLPDVPDPMPSFRLHELLDFAASMSFGALGPTTGDGNTSRVTVLDEAALAQRRG